MVGYSPGLSPRVRGNLNVRRCRVVAVKPRVYPRVCGGTRRTSFSLEREWGLSPRVRGNLVRFFTEVPNRRSIPACAGEPQGAAIPCREIGVYPRVCGGTVRRHRESQSPLGLSPRVRGNPKSIFLLVVLGGSIPACAGEPSQPPHWAQGQKVYPRVCGGTTSSPLDRRNHAGLSPRVRGNLKDVDDGITSVGSIPACAGEPNCFYGEQPPVEVYPRVCGGTRTERTATHYHKGLSPRVRGNPAPPAERAERCGSIPACAGEPPVARRADDGKGVYPRVCGGTGPL